MSRYNKRTTFLRSFSIRNAFEKSNKFNGFTLAEVLVTLGIIGIVAAMTLPTIIQKQQEKITVTKVKEAYSIISQAYFRASEDKGGDISTWDCARDTTIAGGACVVDEFKKFLSIIKDRENSPTANIPYSLNLKQNTAYYHKNLYSITLSNGFILKFHNAYSGCKTYENWNVPEIEKFACSIFVDINGEKQPNALGRDTFVFKLHKNTVSPAGNATEPYYNFQRTCRTNVTNEFWDGGVNGMSCAGWVIAHENLDYLHCTGLSFNGKTKCK